MSDRGSTAPQMGRAEFVALMALLMATIAYSIDAMLPALPSIGAQFSPQDPNRAQLVVGSFILGIGVGTFFVGAISDAFGRKPVLVWGALIYSVAAFTAILAPTLEGVLIARAVQGLGAAAARIVAMAIIRDLYKGREMARLMSLAMLVFTLVPAIAPMAGAIIIAFSDWRGIFASFIVFAAISTLWMAVRLPEPLPVQARKPFGLGHFARATAEVFSHKMTRLSMVVQTLCYTMLFASISSIQQIMDITFDRGDEFPYWFALTALMAALSSLLNATLVMRFGMRKLTQIALLAQAVLTLAVLALIWAGFGQAGGFGLYFMWQVTVFFMVGLTLGNLNALALEPLGHIAGMGSSITTGVATLGSVMLAVPIGLSFDGTPVPLLVGVALCAVLALAFLQPMRRLERQQAAAI